MRRPVVVAVMLLAAALGKAPAQAETCRIAPPVGNSPCRGVRPGAYVGTSDFGGCTLGFLFTGSDKRRYAATAGHCGTALPEQIWPRGNGPVVFGDEYRPIGRFVYAASQGDVDFGLFQLDPGVKSDPQVCHFGGPTRINAGIDTEPVEMRHVGQGFGGELAARTAEAPFGLYREDYTYAWGAAYFGDSGSPVLDAQGQAVGIITELKAAGLGDIGINRLAPRLARIQSLLRVKLTLMTAPAL